MPDQSPPTDRASGLTEFMADRDERRVVPRQAPSPWFNRVLSAGASAAAIVSAIGVAIGLFVGTIGLRVWGPPQELERVRLEFNRRDSTNTFRIVKLEDGAGVMSLRFQALEEATRMNSYILCVYVRRNDPAAVPPGCAPIMSRGAP